MYLSELISMQLHPLQVSEQEFWQLLNFFKIISVQFEWNLGKLTVSVEILNFYVHCQQSKVDVDFSFSVCLSVCKNQKKSSADEKLM